ncbi:MAG: site-specific DNA-methyltransferase [Bacteroidetes bacterium]|nr:site-specific DNA-methyltransferase [Bacteroidota bacterium]
MDGKSLNITEEKLSKLKEIIPEVFTENNIDWEKLKAALGEDIEFKNERYVLNWAGKSDAFRILQSPTTATLIPCKEESVNFDNTKNIFIEGENLEVLKVLQKAYFGKIKMIYIDPPYNTGNDNFIYPDKFSESKEEYLNRIGDKDETGYLTREGLFRKNSKDSGHYHSNWLSMMYPRLFLARNLLRDDGVIFVSIDDNEVHNLRLLMNEVFGEENFLGNIVRAVGQTTGQDSGGLGNSFDFVIAYTKQMGHDLSGLPLTPHDLKRFDNKDDKGNYAYDQMRKTGSGDRREDRPNMYYPINAPDGTEIFPIALTGYEGRWRFEKKTYEKLIKEDLILWKKTKRKDKEVWWPYVKYYAEGRTKRPSPLWNDLDGNKKASRDLRNIFDGQKIFDFPKPVALIKRLINISPNANGDDIILDFFSGSCPTAHSVLDLNKEDGGNRKFILVQLPEKTDEKSEAYKAGYKTIAEIGKERIRRVIKKIKEGQESKLDLEGNSNKLDLGFKVFKLQDSNFKIWRTKIETEEELVEQLQQHLEPLDEKTKTEDVLYELLLKSGVSLTAEIEEKKDYYIVNKDEIVLLLKKVNEKIIKLVIKEKPKKVITLDRLFNNNDQLKTNTALQMKDAGIEFKVL